MEELAVHKGRIYPIMGYLSRGWWYGWRYGLRSKFSWAAIVIGWNKTISSNGKYHQENKILLIHQRTQEGQKAQEWTARKLQQPFQTVKLNE